MSRRLSAGLIGLLLLAAGLTAETPNDTKPPAVEHAAAVQRVVAEARRSLAAGRPAEAAAVLESQLEHAEGNRTFLGLLREAYEEELKFAQVSATRDPARAALVRERLVLLGGQAPTAAPAASVVQSAAPGGPELLPNNPVAERDFTRDAAVAFRQGDYVAASGLFAEAAQRVKLSADEAAAWGYCRLKVAAEKLNAPNLNAATVAGLEREIADALALAPAQAKLQELGQTLLAKAKPKGGAPPTTLGAAPTGWDVLETASFRVRHRGTKPVAEAVAKAAEDRRKATFERWSGPASGGWQPKCEIVLHPKAEDYAQTTHRPAAGTGHATVRFTEGRVAERRIDLRADDATVADDALPRELTHVVLADLFPNSPPPKWAEAGMAVLASSSAEVGRYTRTLPRCAREGELLAVAALFDLKDFPAEKLTGFYCESVSLVEYLVKLRGERNFTIFLRDLERYGTASALKKTYGVDGAAALEQHWRQQALTSSRAQSP